jgi:acetate kinase
MGDAILCLNAGSSSLKFAVYQLQADQEARLFSGAVEAIGDGSGRFWLRDLNNRSIVESQGSFPTHAEAAATMFESLTQQGSGKLSAAGHRVVHGGPYFHQPRRVTAEVVAKLREITLFAPLHLPTQVAMIDEVSKRAPGLTQVVCFDTAFHRAMPEVARRFALPRDMFDQGVLRYGFHGLSYEYVTGKLGKDLGERAIIAHLGNGASMVALKNGSPIDTSMGLTPTGGFMMGTRSGDLDPGVMLYLLRRGWNAQHLEKVLDHQSGLAGVSALTGDMRTLLERRSANPSAAQAVEMFCYQVRKFTGAFAAALRGLDTLVFTGGIGERAAPVRAEICDGLEFLGVRVDTARNARHEPVISADNSTCVVRVVPTDEDLMIARHTGRLLDPNGNQYMSNVP